MYRCRFLTFNWQGRGEALHATHNRQVESACCRRLALPSCLLQAALRQGCCKGSHRMPLRTALLATLRLCRRHALLAGAATAESVPGGCSSVAPRALFRCRSASRASAGGARLHSTSQTLQQCQTAPADMWRAVEEQVGPLSQAPMVRGHLLIPVAISQTLLPSTISWSAGAGFTTPGTGRQRPEWRGQGRGDQSAPGVAAGPAFCRHGNNEVCPIICPVGFQTSKGARCCPQTLVLLACKLLVCS